MKIENTFYFKYKNYALDHSLKNYFKYFFYSIINYLHSCCTKLVQEYRNYWNSKTLTILENPSQLPLELHVDPTNSPSFKRAFVSKRTLVAIALVTSLCFFLALRGTSPLVEPHQIQVFTSYTLDNAQRIGMSQSVARHQEAYCKQFGYDYKVFTENLAPDSLPYWSKIAGMIRLLTVSRDKKWFVWMDDDAIILNPQIRLEEIINNNEDFSSHHHVVISKDIPSAPTALNTGVLFVRNSDFSRQFFKTLWNKRHDLISGASYTYANCPNQICLHEQQALHDLLQFFPWYKKHVSLIPQRSDKWGINTFERFSHFDINRNTRIFYDDPISSRCDPTSDFICQCTGLATSGYKVGEMPDKARNLRLECIDTLIQTSNAKRKINN